MILADARKLDDEIIKLQKKIAAMPSGKLVCTKNRKYFKWYHSDGHSLKYIPKKNRLFAEELARKQYYIEMLNELLYEKKSIELYLKHQDKGDLKKGRGRNLRDTSSEIDKLLLESIQSRPKKIKEWLEEPYEKILTFKKD